MYWVCDNEQALTLTRRAADMESKTKSEMIADMYLESYLHSDEHEHIKPIFEHIPSKDLKDENIL